MIQTACQSDQSQIQSHSTNSEIKKEPERVTRVYAEHGIIEVNGQAFLLNQIQSSKF